MDQNKVVFVCLNVKSLLLLPVLKGRAWFKFCWPFQLVCLQGGPL